MAEFNNVSIAKAANILLKEILQVEQLYLKIIQEKL